MGYGQRVIVQEAEANMHNTKGMTLGFKTRYEALDFVRLGEAEGYTFEGKELLEESAA